MRAVITGASSGIGRALALAVARRHPEADLLLIARRLAPLEAVAAELAAAAPGVRPTVAAIDVSDGAQLVHCCEAYLRGGLPDLVIANAGVSGATATEAAQGRLAFRRVIEVNVLGMVDTLGPFISPMRAARRGTLVGVASVAGIRGLPGAGAYSASKAAAINYLESLRVELHGSGVRVVTIAPGFIRTPMTAVNPYPMPFLMDADTFAARALDAIAAGERFRVIPWPMAGVARLLRWVPNALYDRLAARSPRKPVVELGRTRSWDRHER